MPVRNLDAINRHGAQIAQQQSNAKKMREESFWKRVDIIRATHDDAVDFVDTVDALIKNGMVSKFNKWLENQDLEYSSWNKKIHIGASSSGVVYYVPKENDICFGWSECGMCEYYSVNIEGQTDYLIHQRLKCYKYDERLTLMAERLQPFLDFFFKWVDTL